jgi:RNA polymerase sigma-70 factor (ECF subfamily)
MSTAALVLMDRARAGQTDALGELCSLYREYLRRVARREMGPKLHERVDVSDVVQEALVEVIRRFPQFTGRTEAELAGWLRRLVGQKLVDIVRYHGRVKRGAGDHAASLDAWHGAANGESGIRLVDTLDDSHASPSEIASHRELTRLLGKALTKLPEDEAEVLRLYHVEGLSFESIGERLGLGRKPVRALWARGLQSLRRTLDGPPAGKLRLAAADLHRLTTERI